MVAWGFGVCMILTWRSLWRALANYWHNLKDGIAWSIGNGSSIRVLDDAWLPKLGPLRPYLSPAAMAFPPHSILDLLDSNGAWDRGIICSTFRPEVLPHILGIKPPTAMDDTDRIVWRWLANLSFDLKSAYSLLSQHSWDIELPIWKTIWQIWVP
ncbi:hypothetical protein HRI_000966600 [Hibiscus trionum]|uniref:Reverse transcriptase zinc-binding domain-containing protein n=1 Tax=Hibiscus trionum TaxID=183268 RepID=A0A9W7H944_HIBTR|nr:hypothetical protein HRI_000966600 [Hibiscus trionum]